jgi:RimJ/RimL family protein N-acetyltransferase
MEHPYWPLFNLRITNALVEIRLATDEDLVELAGLAARGVHDPSTMPFLTPWTDERSPLIERGLLQWAWGHRATWQADSWKFNGAVVVDGVVVGVQDIWADHFARDREVKTGSWLGREYHGRGIGTAMRDAMLAFAFDGLGASAALSGGFPDNAASLGVSRKLGYEETGRRWVTRRGEAAEVIDLRLTRAVWVEHRQSLVTIDGLEGCLEFFVGSE